MSSAANNRLVLEEKDPTSPRPDSGLRPWLAKRLRRPHHIPIAYKLALAITLLIVAGMSVLGIVVITNQSSMMRDQANAYGQTVAGQLAESSKELILAEDELGLQVAVSSLATNPNLQGVVIFSEDGAPLAETGVRPHASLIELYERGQRLGDRGYSLDWHWTDNQGQRRDAVSFLAPVRFNDVVVGHALVTFSRASMVESSRAAKRAILITTLLLSILAIAVAFIMSKQLSRPIYDLMDASRAIGAGNYDYRISTRRRDELGTLIGAFNDMAKSLLEKSQVEDVLSRYVSPTVAREILANLDQVELGGKHIQATVMFADIVGFTRLSEQMTPTQVGAFLNTYFGLITRATERYKGNVDKFIGDCAMVVFGAPEADSDHRFNAIACAVMIRRLTDRLNEDRQREGKPPVHFRIGINTGDMLAGNMGAQERMQYTVVGDAVNLASRLSAVAGSREIVIRDEHYLDPEVQRRVIARRYKTLRVRGRDEPITVYRVKDVASSYRKQMDEDLRELLDNHPL